MGRLTDLLAKKGMIEGVEPADESEGKKEGVQLITERFRIQDISKTLQKSLQDLSQQYQSLGKKIVFSQLSSINEFYIPSMMNGRVIECSEETFQEEINGKNVVLAKAYSFDGRQVKYLFYDCTDGTIQQGAFTEFPRDALGNKMGRLGFEKNLLCWKTKSSVER